MTQRTTSTVLLKARILKSEVDPSQNPLWKNAKELEKQPVSVRQFSQKLESMRTNVGVLTSACRFEIQEGNGDKLVSPRLAAMLTSLESEYKGGRQDPSELFQDAVLVLAKANFPYNAREIYLKNNFPKADTVALSQQAASTLLQYGHIKSTDSVIDIGTNLGGTPKELQGKVKEIVAIEQRKKPFEAGLKENFPDALKISLDEYSKESSKKFDVVHIGHFSPTSSRHKNQSFDKRMSSFIKNCRNLTKPQGVILLGVSGINRNYINTNRLRLSLEKEYRIVEWIDWSSVPYQNSTEENTNSIYQEGDSLGGQLGYFKCSNLIEQEACVIS